MTFITILYMLLVTLLAAYAAGQVLMLIGYLLSKRLHKPVQSELVMYPDITLQLPIFNESAVVQRLLWAITRLDYPQEKLHIQVLDDSTDHTVHLVRQLVQEYSEKNFDIRHLHRENRQGFKAGALAEALEQTESDFIVIFDADFVPEPDFLKRCLPTLLMNDQIGCVQTRWGHLNADENALTKAQRLSVDAHFVIEQSARNYFNWLLPFNGTGGIWRKACIEDAGGWSAATLTEDFDLSYRAQLKGWKVRYLSDVVVPGELPPQLKAYQRQQARWATGSTQCLKRYALPVLRSDFGLLTRIMALHHLCQYIPQLLMLSILLLSPFVAWAGLMEAWPLAPLSVLGFVPPMMFLLSQYDTNADWKKSIIAFPVLLLLATGLIASNTVAIMKGLSGQVISFERTPKFSERWQNSPYALKTTIWSMEVFFLIYSIISLLIAWLYQPEMIIYIAIYALGFGAVVSWQWLDQYRLTRTPRQQQSLPASKTSSLT